MERFEVTLIHSEAQMEAEQPVERKPFVMGLQALQHELEIRPSSHYCSISQNLTTQPLYNS